MSNAPITSRPQFEPSEVPQTIPTTCFSILTVANVHVQEPSAFNPNRKYPIDRNHTLDGEDRSHQGSNTHQNHHRQGGSDDEHRYAPSFRPRLHPRQHCSRILRNPLPVSFRTQCNFLSPPLLIHTQLSSCRAADPRARSSEAPCISSPCRSQKPPRVGEGPSALEAAPCRLLWHSVRFGSLKGLSVFRSRQIPLHQLKKLKTVRPRFL